ncbi:MAG: tagaturonate reductase, partial [Bacteroidota bacterium]
MALSYSALPPKVLQFGGGNFLRAFLGWMVQHLNEAEDFGASIVLVKPTPGGDYVSLRQQAGRYHVLLNGIQDGEARQDLYPINCIAQIIQPYQEWDAFLQSARLPSMRYVVSNTTEAGIVFEAESHYQVGVPRTFPGKLTAWLYERYQYFAKSPASGCIMLPCELVPDNGDLLRRTLLQYASHWGLEADFVSWVNLHNHFCDTLVDRIVSGYDAKVAEDISDQLAFPDPNLVVGEHYHSWVIKSEPELRVQLPFLAPTLNNSWTEDLQLYRQRKVRILNGAHMTIVPLGHMLGLKTVKEAMEHPALSRFLQALLQEEVIPSIELDEAELLAYQEDILDRFRNPFLEHR